jgi:predicted DCC family thiol-disulfide oxidoreductase YuxK
MSDMIIFYDGDCGLCNRSVQFVLKHERCSEISFSALQSDFAKTFFDEHQLPSADFSTFYFYKDNHLYQKSKAAFKVISYLKWYWRPLRIFSLLPVKLTDSVYNFIAKRRKKIGGTFCVIPSEGNRNRFIS